jgi:hypothetical protein
MVGIEDRLYQAPGCKAQQAHSQRCEKRFAERLTKNGDFAERLTKNGAEGVLAAGRMTTGTRPANVPTMMNTSPLSM